MNSRIDTFASIKAARERVVDALARLPNTDQVELMVMTAVFGHAAGSAETHCMIGPDESEMTEAWGAEVDYHAGRILVFVQDALEWAELAAMTATDRGTEYLRLVGLQCLTTDERGRLVKIERILQDEADAAISAEERAERDFGC